MIVLRGADMITKVYECGPMGPVLAALGVIGLFFALACAVAIGVAKRPEVLIAVGIGAGVLGLLAVALGPIGAQVERHAAMRLVAGDPLLDDVQRAEFRERASQWARECVPIGAAGGAAPLVVGCAAIVTGIRRRRRARSRS
jgi:hypothetical protein